MGSETCVRMRGGMYNDALCNDSNGFNKKEMQVRNSFRNIEQDDSSRWVLPIYFVHIFDTVHQNVTKHITCFHYTRLRPETPIC